MPEVPYPGKHHGEAGAVGGLDDLAVAHRSARLNDCRRARFGGGKQAVGERKKRIRGDDRSLGEAFGKAGGSRGLGGFHRRDPRGIDAAHLSRANPHRRAALGVDDRIRLHMFGHAEGEFEIAPFPLVWRALGDDAQIHVFDIRMIAGLRKKTARYRTKGPTRPTRIRQAAG